MVDRLLRRVNRKLAEAESSKKLLQEKLAEAEQENKRLQSEKKLLQETLAQTQRAKKRVIKEMIAALQDAQNAEEQLNEVLAGNEHSA